MESSSLTKVCEVLIQVDEYCVVCVSAAFADLMEKVPGHKKEIKNWLIENQETYRNIPEVLKRLGE